MPRVPIPGQTGPPFYLPSLPHGIGDVLGLPIPNTPGKPTQALAGWADLNMTVARTLPTQLVRAGRLQRAARVQLGARSRRP